MKKFLGILLTTVMLLTSMGVLGAGTEATESVDPNVVYYTGFEDEGLPSPFLQGTSSNSGKYWAIENAGAYAGNKCLKVAFFSADGGYRVYMNRLAIEPSNAVYKLSFWFKYGVFANDNIFSPRIVIQDTTNASAAVNLLYSRANGDILPTCNKEEWTYYEIYFPVTNATTHLSIHLYNAGTAKQLDAFYYDEFKIEKVDGTDFLFAEGDATKAGFAMSNLTSEQFGATTGNNYAKGTEITVGNETVTMYPFVLTAKPKTTAAGVVRVLSNNVPKTANDKTVLVAGIYKDDTNGTPVLKNVVVKPCDFAAANGKLGACVDYVDVDMTNYADCYVKAFTLSSLADLKAVSEGASLPAAQ